MVDKFTESLIVESIGNKWQLTKPFYFYYKLNEHKIHNIIVPKNFITDFASTPKILYPLLPPVGIYNKATIVHDFLYSKQSSPQFTREVCDRIFLQALEVLSVPKWKRLLMFWGVRIFGKKHFRRS